MSRYDDIRMMQEPLEGSIEAEHVLQHMRDNPAHLELIDNTRSQA